MKIFGHLEGLKPSQRHRLDLLAQRKVPRSLIVSSSLALSMCELAEELGRQIGVTLDRNGRIEHVIVGDAERLWIPDLGRARAGRGRLRGIRLVHTHLNDEPLNNEDKTDLLKLRLDMIAVIGINEIGRPQRLSYSYIEPQGFEIRARDPIISTVYDEEFDFSSFILELEDEFNRAMGSVIENSDQQRALAVHVSLDDSVDPRTALKELSELARTAGILLVDAVVQKRKQFDPKYVVGRGKLDEIISIALALDCEMIIFDQELSPNQVRSICEATSLNVIDRSLLILDIFADRAQSREGKLAVELAALKYRLPRLVHRRSNYTRQMGDVGGRGPGETKLEIDRRRARERIYVLEKALETVGVQRQNRRNKRQGRNVPVVALVGYTNAGKSTLFNALTQSDVLVEDKLFATLDVTTRRLRFPQDRELVLIDTVGFIRDLPKDLHAAFKATLEELRDADLLLHVVDIADPHRDEQIASVERILGELDLGDRSRILVFNKIDLLDPQIALNICTLAGAYGVEATDRRSMRSLLNEVELRLWQRENAPEPEPEPWEIEPVVSEPEETLDPDLMDEEMLERLTAPEAGRKEDE